MELIIVFMVPAPAGQPGGLYQADEWIKIYDSTDVVACRYSLIERYFDIEFRRGVTYRYRGINPAIYAGFVDSVSKGRYVRQVLKDYPCEVLSKEEENHD